MPPHIGGLGLGRMMRGESSMENTKPVKITNRRMLAWFYRNLLPHWKRVLVSVIALLASTAAGLAIPLVLRDIFDDVIMARNLQPLGGLILQFLLLTLAAQAFGALRTNVMHILGQRFVHSVRMECFSHLIKLGLNYFQRERSGDIMSRISNDVGAVERMVVHGTDDIVGNSLQIIGAIGILFWLDWRMALVALAPLPVFVALLWVFAHFIRPIFNTIRKELGEINARLQERIAGMHVIKAFAREKAEVEYFEESSHAYYKANSRSIWMWSTFFPVLFLVTSLGLVLLVWYGSRRAAMSTGAAMVSAGTVVAFLRYMQDFYGPVGALARVQNMINESLAAVARLFQLLDEVPSVADKEHATELDQVRGRVELQNVSFKYDTGEVILRDVSVIAEPGEVVAIVGRSGAGKTSLVNLIARFYDPAEGRVLIDGIDARDVKQASLRKHIGMVLQETFLFNTTVRENIIYARPDATMEEVVAAAKGAHAHDFIERLPDGYNTVIGERGVRLSGGEKQRIAIARAFLSNPRILILDEATSMVDTEAEHIIQKALAGLMQGRTTFVIAHRLSTVRHADKIIVIDAGQIVEQDNHEGLMQKNGLYKEMITRQFHLDEEWGEAKGLSPEMLR